MVRDFPRLPSNCRTLHSHRIWELLERTCRKHVPVSRGYTVHVFFFPLRFEKLINIHRTPFRNCRGVSLIHASIVVPLAIRCLDSPALSVDRAFGWDEKAGTLLAVAAGYFLWDTIDTIINFEGFGFVAHGSCHPSTLDSCTHLQEAIHRCSVFLRVPFVFRKPARRLCGGRLCLMYSQRPFLAYYAVRCLLWEG